MAHALNGEQLQCLAEAFITQIDFLGSFAKDELIYLLSKKKPVSCAFVNTHPRYKPGEHWTAIYFPVNRNERPEFFDSYGKTCTDYGFDVLAGLNPRMANGGQIQSSNSDYCGFYCLYYLFFKQPSEANYNFNPPFGGNGASNDKVVLNFVNSMRYKLKRFNC